MNDYRKINNKLYESCTSIVENRPKVEKAELLDSSAKTLLDGTAAASSILTIYPYIVASHADRLTKNFTLYTEKAIKGDNHPTEPTGYRSMVTPHGKPLFVDHYYSTDSVQGRIIVAKCKKVKSGSETPRRGAGIPGSWEGTYTLDEIGQISNPEAIRKILTAEMLNVSIGVEAHQIIDSITRQDVLKLWKEGKPIKHWKGDEVTVDGKKQLCYWIIPSWTGIETSFTPTPADELAGIQVKDIGESAVKLLLAQKMIGRESYEMLDAETGAVEFTSDDVDSMTAFAPDLSFKDSCSSAPLYNIPFDYENIAQEASLIMESLENKTMEIKVLFEKLNLTLPESEVELETLNKSFRGFLDCLESQPTDTLEQLIEANLDELKTIYAPTPSDDSTDSSTPEVPAEPVVPTEPVIPAEDSTPAPVTIGEALKSVSDSDLDLLVGELTKETIQHGWVVSKEGIVSRDLTMVSGWIRSDILGDSIETIDATELTSSELLAKIEESDKNPADPDALLNQYKDTQKDHNYLQALVGLCRKLGISFESAKEYGKAYSVLPNHRLETLLLKAEDVPKPENTDNDQNPKVTPESNGHEVPSTNNQSSAFTSFMGDKSYEKPRQLI